MINLRNMKPIQSRSKEFNMDIMEDFDLLCSLDRSVRDDKDGVENQ